MTIRLNRILSLFMVLTVPLFFVACESEEPGFEEEGELGAETDGLGQTPMDQPTAGTDNFTSWDMDRDTTLTEDEFGTGTGAYWTQWDSDADGALTQDEFDNEFQDYDWYQDGLFSEWDSDGNGELTEDEWQSGLFGTWDENQDNRLQEEEYQSDLFG